MKTASAGLLNLLNNGIDVRAYPSVIAEWNQNRYATIEKIGNAWSETDPRTPEDQLAFDIKSIAEPNRPTKGIFKGFAVREASYAQTAWRPRTKRPYTRLVPDVRSYTVGADSFYKYWASFHRTSQTVSGSADYEFTVPTAVQPYVLYKDLTWANKIVLGFETSWAKPTRMTVAITTDGTNWTTISNNPAVSAAGQVVLYLQDNATWGATVNRDAAMKIRGVKVTVWALDKGGFNANVIEVSARLENDLTEFIMDTNSDLSMDDSNFITPLGTCSANVASLTLSNIDSRFNNENPNSIYYGLIEKNVKFTCDMNYTLPGGSIEAVRLYTMYADEWSGDAETEIEVELKDYSKFFQEQVAPQRLTEDVTVGEAVWRLCDTVGFVDYVYTGSANAANTQIPYFWTDGEKTVWEVFQEIAEATQTAIFFDEYGKLQIQTRDAAFSKTKPLTWQFDATSENGKLPDIQEAEIGQNYEANHAEVTYRNTKVSDYGTGFPVMETVWEPEGTFVLRATNMYLSAMTAASTEFRISPTAALSWPYEGKVQIEGEILSYKGKRYSYYSKDTNKVETVVLLTKEEKDFYDSAEKTVDAKKYLNAFTGHLVGLKRGLDGTVAVAHTLTPRPLAVTSTRLKTTATANRGTNAWVKHNPERSTITFGPGSSRGAGDWHSATAVSAVGSPTHFGTSFKFTKTGYHKPAGFFIHGGAADSGYFFHFVSTQAREANTALAAGNYEMKLVVRRPNGTWYSPPGWYQDEAGLDIRGDARGIPMVIATDVFYDIDVISKPRGDGRHGLQIYVDGKSAGYFAVNRTTDNINLTGEFGVWIDHNAQIEVDYLYAHKGADVTTLPDQDSVTDKIRGGLASNFWYTTMYQQKNLPNNWNSYTKQPFSYYFDEFGPIVHEIRDIDVTFEKFPVLHSRLYFSNDSQIACPEYVGTPFGAKFTLVNRSRRDAIGQGEDSVTFGADNSVDQKMMVYGRLIFQEDEETITVKDEESLRARGKIEVQIENQWIQNKTEAQSLADWIVQNWAAGNEEVSLTAFGNPLIQIGDLVSVNYPNKGIYFATHKYFVTSVSNTFSEGLETQLTLRRARI